MKRIKRFGVYQTAKVAGVIYFLLTAVFMVPFASFNYLFFSDMPSAYPIMGGFFFIIAPFIYGILGFIFTAIGCVTYNFISKWTGGIEVEVETDEPIAE